jgi:hypothetical protein
MASGIDIHLRELEDEARQAEVEVEEFKEQADHRTEDLNRQINELVASVQRAKQKDREILERKKLVAKKKRDEVATFRVSWSTSRLFTFLTRRYL